MPAAVISGWPSTSILPPTVTRIWSLELIRDWSLAKPAESAGETASWAAMPPGDRSPNAATTAAAIRIRGRPWLLLLRHHGQPDGGGILRSVMNHVVRRHRVLLVVVRPASIEVPLVHREGAAGDCQPDPVARLEDVGGDQRRELHLVDLVPLHEHRLLVTVAPADPQRLFIQVPRFSIRGDVHQLGEEVGVFRIG